LTDPIRFYLAACGLVDVSLWTLGEPQPTSWFNLASTACGIARDRREAIFVGNNLIGPGIQFVAKYDADLAVPLARYEGSEWEGFPTWPSTVTTCKWLLRAASSS